jgi:hypothetical protein
MTSELIDDLVTICHRYVLNACDAAVIAEPYVPFIPDRGYPGRWNRVLVLGEAQNLSDTIDSYVRRLRASSPTERIHRLYWEREIHVKPWDDGTLKLAMSAAFGSHAERFAVSNAVLWSTKTLAGNNETPRASLQARSQELWKEILPLLDPTHVVTTGKVARELMARVRVELRGQWVHVPLCSASPRYLAGRAAKANETEIFRLSPRLAEAVRTNPEYIEKYRKNRIYFAFEAIQAVDAGGRGVR